MEAPQGFLHDPNSGLYYSEKQSKDNVTGAAVRLVTWFDPKTGASRQSSYPVAEPQASNPETSEPVTATPVSTAAPESVPSVPKSKPIQSGFVLDSGSKLYYRSEQGVDGKGTPIQRVTYYDPAKGTYHAVDYPVKQTPTAQVVNPLPAPPEPPPDFSDVGVMLQQEQYQPAPKKKSVLPIAVACSAVLLVALGICAWQFGWFSGKDPAPNSSDASTAPENSSDIDSATPAPEKTVRSEELASSYAYEKILSGEKIELFLPDGQNFELRYDYNSSSQVVTGTYTLLDGMLTLSGQAAASGWSDGSVFSIQKFRRIRYEGPENIGGFVTGMTLKPSDGTGELTDEQKAELERDAAAADEAAARERESNSFVGAFVCADPDIPEELRPSFTIDGKYNLCTVSFNFDNQMLNGTFTYYWEKGSDTISLYLSSYEDRTHPAKDLPNPKIKIIDENTLQFLSEDFGEMGSGEYKGIFIKQ